MSTIDSWAGNIADIGPIYPFVGSEFLLCVIGFAAWIAWFVLQARMENREYEQEMEQRKQHDQTLKPTAGE